MRESKNQCLHLPKTLTEIVKYANALAGGLELSNHCPGDVPASSGPGAVEKVPVLYQKKGDWGPPCDNGK